MRYLIALVVAAVLAGAAISISAQSYDTGRAAPAASQPASDGALSEGNLAFRNLHDFRERHDYERHSIGCTNCHDPDNHMRLVITSIPLAEEFETRDHGVAAKPHFPWAYGMNAEDMYRYKSEGQPERDGFKGQFADWVHAVSKTPMIKVQHPEYEMFHDSVHAQEKSVRAHEAVRRAMETPGVDETLLAEAREMTRKGQWFWDYVSAENSAGAHNPVKALDTLASSQQFSDEAVQLAIRASNYQIAAAMDRPIDELVPPIRQHSRKLQQSQEHLDSHPWLQYLPLLPEAELIWNGNQRVN